MKSILFLLFIVFTSTYAQNTVCPFHYLYHLGDGVFDNGNAILNQHLGSRLPAARRPYGISHPSRGPTGRWSDGLLDIDYGAIGLGFPTITPYLAANSSRANAIMFAVARSPVLDVSFFRSRGVRMPYYAAPLSVQIGWFRDFIGNFTTAAARADHLASSLVLFGDVEANDITIALSQGRSLQEVRGYVPQINQAQINAAREVIRMGATRVILPGNAPMGCYPFVQTRLASNNAHDYDDIGCLRAVNDLMIVKNFDLQQRINRLRDEFPNIFIMYADFYNSEEFLIREMIREYGNSTLTSCCGVGGRYNYDNRRFCGSGVPVCSNPNNYFFWDGIHLTGEANNRLSSALAEDALVVLNCTVT